MLESLCNKPAGRKACNFIKKRLQQSYFPVNIEKILRTPILKNICKRLLLDLKTYHGYLKHGENRGGKRKKAIHNNGIRGIFRSYQTSAMELFGKNS